MSLGLLSRTRRTLGEAQTAFECCDTAFRVHAAGYGAAAAVARAEETARRLEGVLNAFDDESAVSRLARTGRVDDPHVAAVVERGMEYQSRTGGAFAIGGGETERELKAYIRGESDTPPSSASGGSTADVSVRGTTVEADAPVDLNGLAKGYIVDRATEELRGRGRTGFVDGGGDISSPTGPVAIESPFGGERPLRVLSTDWNVATSAGYRRRRGSVDHIYDPRTGRLGSRHDVVTVVARRDCMEADALATTLSSLPLDEALALAEEWSGLEAFVVHEGVFHATEGFDRHVA